MIRRATHAGTWYEDDPIHLGKQIDSLLKLLGLSRVKGARMIVAPHAGYAYSGPCIGKLFAAWDHRDALTVFILGPSHHVYFKDKVGLSKYSTYWGPLGPLSVDTLVVGELISAHPDTFSYMSEEVDDAEHSFEMLLPFLSRVVQNSGMEHPPKIIPILISDMNDRLASDLAAVLGKYAHNPRFSFLISSDFCHWGSRFRYTQYWNKLSVDETFEVDASELEQVKFVKSLDFPIHKSIEALDTAAMEVASRTCYEEWRRYIETTGNTICGEKAIGVLILMMQQEFVENLPHFEWTGYAQSGSVTSPDDSSVSYASGYAVLEK